MAYVSNILISNRMSLVHHTRSHIMDLQSHEYIIQEAMNIIDLLSHEGETSCKRP